MSDLKRKGAGEPQETLSEFKDMFSLLAKPKRGFRVHPSKADLKAYLRGDLADEWRKPDAADGDPWMDESQKPESWTFQEVSLHVATCHSCSREMAALRNPNAPKRFEEYFLAFNIAGLRGRLWSYANAVALVAAFAVITQISWNSNPIVDLPDRASPIVQNAKSPLHGIKEINNFTGASIGSQLIPVQRSSAGGGGGGVSASPSHRGNNGLSL